MTKPDIDSLVNQLLTSSDTHSLTDWAESFKLPLSKWQISQLENVKNSELGIKCLLDSWLVTQKSLQDGSFCNATWDNFYCWPPTPLGTTVNQTCVDVFNETGPSYASHLKGHAHRVCLPNGSWLWDKYTNYNECADSYDAFWNGTVKHNGTVKETDIVPIVRYIFFIGSIISLVFVLSAILTFYKFRSLWCDRVTIHMHHMAALVLRYITLLIITEPHIFNHSTSYRSYDLVCKGVLIVNQFTTLSCINWMFIEGIYSNGKLTTNIFDRKAPLKLYYIFGWVYPLVLVTVWATMMSFNHEAYCWSGYSAMNELWIITAPIMFALIVNLIFLLNILRVMLTKGRTPEPNTEAMQFWRAAKATLLLFPLLGINNVLVLYNFGGDLHDVFVVLNTFFSSTQGVFVAIGYCFLNDDVWAAFQRVYRRFLARRSANNIRCRERSQSRQNPDLPLQLF